MLPRKKLVPLKTEFGRIRQTGKMYDSPSFGLIVEFGSKKGAQAAFVISKKIDKRSTVRHLVKRKLADAVTAFLPRLAGNTELVFLAKQKAVDAPAEQLKAEIDSVLKRAKLI